jgi:hypothetical protein
MMKRSVTRDLINHLRKIEPKSLLRYRTWQDMISPPPPLSGVEKGARTGSTAWQHDGTLNINLDAADDFPDIPYAKMQMRQGRRLWQIPLFVHYDQAGQARLGQLDGQTIYRTAQLETDVTEVLILVGKMTPQGRWDSVNQPQWFTALESDPYGGYPALTEFPGPVVLAVIPAQGNGQITPLEYAEL